MRIPALLLPLHLCRSTEHFCGGPTLTAPKLAVLGGEGALSGAMSQRVAPTCIGYASHLDCPYAACQLVICRFGLAAGSRACALGDCHPCVICHACMAICVYAQPEAPQGCMWWVRGQVLPRSHSEMLRRVGCQGDHALLGILGGSAVSRGFRRILYLTGESCLRFRARGERLGLRVLRETSLASLAPLFAGLHAVHSRRDASHSYKRLISRLGTSCFASESEHACIRLNRTPSCWILRGTASL